MKQSNNTTISTRARRAQVLIETLIAVSVLTVGFLGIVTLLARALSLNRVVADNYKATYLAEEGIEITKNILDGNVVQSRPWNDGFANGQYTVEPDSTDLETANLGSALRFNPATGLYDYSGPAATSFRRRIDVELVGQNEVQVESTVTWTTRGGGSFSVTLEDHFFNWRP